MTRPLLAARDLASPLAWIDGEPVSGGQFIADALALADRLPAGGSPVNLCQDRYAFALGLAAALLRGQTSLMPPNALPDTLRQIGQGVARPYALVDQPAADCGGLPWTQAARTPGLSAAQAVPAIPAGLEAVRLLTSGSTGQPQPHGKRWGSLVTNIAGEAERLSALLGQPSLAGLNLVATVPAQHSYGLESSVLLALLGGACFDAGRPFYPADIAAALARLPAPRGLVTTPFHLKALLQAGVELPPLAMVLSATAPLSPQLAALAETRSGGRMLEIYGCTEAGQVAARRTTDGDLWTTLGALQLTPAAALGAGDAAADDRTGLCAVSGGHVEQPTVLGDRLELLDSRRFRLLGRANDLIHVAGKRSSLAHLNFHLNRIDGIDDGAFWMPDDVADGIARPVAFVVAPRLSAAQVVQALRQGLEAAFVPRRVVHVDALPREATGKLTTETLARFAQQQLAAAAVVDELVIAADHPAFDGHFPGQPVLPGVVLLSLLMESIERRPALKARIGATPQIEHVKFLAPVGPGTALQLTLRPTAGGVAFELHHGVQAVVRGELAGGRAG